MILPLQRHWRGFPALILAAIPAAAIAQPQGTFIIPTNRAGDATRFSYWQAYTPAGQTTYNGIGHRPNLIPDLGDSADPVNFSNWNTGNVLHQIGTPSAFVLSSGQGIYSFAGVAAYRISYTHSGDDEVKGVVLQLKMAGSVPLSSVELRYTPEGASEETVLAPHFKALDNPGTAAFAEQLLWAYEWNLTGKGVRDYDLYFSTGGSSNPLYEVQTDTTVAPAFVQQLGYLMVGRALPPLRYKTPGKALPDGAVVFETRFFKAGQSFPMVAQPEEGFEHVGWVAPDGIVVDSAEPFTVTFSETEPSDLTASAVFAPVSWAIFRNSWFNHEFTHGGQTLPDDSMDDTKSAPEVDLDGDGMSNFSEYAFGGQPYTQDAERMTPRSGVATVDGASYPTITFRRRAAVGSDLRYVVEVSSDLQTWSQGTAEQPVAELTNGPLESDGTRTVTARSLNAGGNSSRFLRVKAETIPQ
ncbi:MAG: hypothetical protein EOP86_10220 [Verrucomicrobiaceae bacterium]|nr:MAG: hypothetical protein EOP86_10220 [Verrucomicrobiaceae bacterium]